MRGTDTLPRVAGDAAHSLFKQLNPNDPIFRGTITTRTVQRGQHLYWPRETRAYVYLIHCGSMKTYRLLQDCSERINGFHFPGELLGLDALFGLPVRRGAVALNATTVYLIPVTMLHDHVSRSELTRFELLGHFHAEITRLEEHLSLEQLNAEERLAAFVLWAMEKLAGRNFSSTVILPMSHKDIGNYLGLVPETISRILARFADRRWLSVKRRELTVQNLPQLRRAASGANRRAADDIGVMLAGASTRAAHSEPALS